MPTPQIGPDEVLVEVKAAGLNLLDSKIRDGEFTLLLPYKPPLVLGRDLAGIVVEAGADVRRFKPGDAVCVSSGGIRKGAGVSHFLDMSHG